MSDNDELEIDENIMGRYGEDIKQQFVQGITAHERVGVGGLTHVGEESSKDPLDRFKNKIGYIGTLLEKDIRQEDILAIQERGENLEYKYINPGAFILGYIASNGGRNMNVDRVRHAFGLIIDITEEGITQPDVVRYARYWMKIGVK